MYSRIIGTGSYLPQKVLTNKDLESLVDTTDEWIVERTGIKQRHIAAENESTSSMAINASIDAGATGIQIGNGFGQTLTKNQTQKVSIIVNNRCSIKAVGGIKTLDQAIEIMESGATYVGTTFGFEIAQEQKKKN